MAELLLELYIEEIPALMQKNAEICYKDIYAAAFKAASIAYDSLDVYIGPRRITLHVAGLPDKLEAQNIEVKGPKISAPDQALEGFCRSNGISKDDLIQKDGCYFYEKKIAAKPLTDILPDLLSAGIVKYVWPKSMHWGDYKIKFVRPLLNILCIFDGKVLDMEYGHLKANNKSYGHRFASYKAIEVLSFKDYQDKLSKANVVLDRNERLKIIQDGIGALEQRHNIKAFEESRLLEEVAGLNEHVNVLAGRINEKFMHIPAEALVSSMKAHQKYFPCRDKAGDFAPYFIFVSNVPTSDDADIVDGNEKVLSARLSDALYFFEQDQKTKLKARDLSKIVFHANIGTMQDKVERIVKIADYLDKGNKNLLQAASICKSDLVTEMVGEFPELQGIMGYYYAKLEGAGEEVAVAIRDHYKPMGGDDLPSGLSAKLALADKIDSLVGLMIAGERATGSKDPFALRRMALGIIKIILAEKMDIKLVGFISRHCEELSSTATQLDIINFIQDRLRNHYKEEYGPDLVKAGIDLSLEDNLLITDSKMQALKEFANSSEGEELMMIYRRITNILEDKDYGKMDATLLGANEEKNLYNKMLELIPKVENHLKSNHFNKALKEILELKKPLADFFDNVIVNDDNPKIAMNRKSILQSLSRLFKQIAHFEYI